MRMEAQYIRAIDHCRHRHPQPGANTNHNYLVSFLLHQVEALSLSILLPLISSQGHLHRPSGNFLAPHPRRPPCPRALASPKAELLRLGGRRFLWQLSRALSHLKDRPTASQKISKRRRFYNWASVCARGWHIQAQSERHATHTARCPDAPVRSRPSSFGLVEHRSWVKPSPSTTAEDRT